MIMGDSKGFGGALAIILILAGVAGWAIIEFVLWLLSFVTISFGG